MNTNQSNIGFQFISTMIDNYFITYMTSKVINIIKQLDNSFFIDYSNHIHNEIHTFIEFCYYLLTIQQQKSTIGMLSVGIELDTTQLDQPNNLIIFSIYQLSKLLFNKFYLISIDSNWNHISNNNINTKIFSKILYYINIITKITTITNYITAICTGDYPIFLYRVLGLKLMVNNSYKIIIFNRNFTTFK